MIACVIMMTHVIAVVNMQIKKKGEKIMKIWLEWWKWAELLRGACARRRTFYWLLVALIGFSIREDLLGVSSFIRSIGLYEFCYDRILDFFHSPALNVLELNKIWTAIVFKYHPGILRFNGMAVIVCDGLKNAKSGKKMPGVKLLHQESESNTKPEYIMGHSCQAASVLVKGLFSVMALPLAARIHEGVVYSNRDKRTLLDKMIELVFDLGIQEKFIMLADAYYASRKVVLPLLERGCHLVSRVQKNAVAYYPPPPPKPGKRGRKNLYGKKVKLASFFDNQEKMTEAESPVYGEENVTLRFRTIDLLWRPIGIRVRFVAVIHPSRGKCILMSTNMDLNALQIIELYGFRFKIEVSFKQAIHTVGSYRYHFWMEGMTPQKRNGGNQYMHHKTEEYRKAVRRKLDAYHRFMQVGLVAQGIMVAIATTVPGLVWNSFGSWFRTIRYERCPSEMVVSIALRNSFPEFLTGKSSAENLVKFILERVDFSRKNSSKLAA